MLPLSLSYDHRVIDGADAARFLRWVAEAFEQPVRADALLSASCTSLVVQERSAQECQEACVIEQPCDRTSSWHLHLARDTEAMSNSTQLVVIGAGPGGYAAAFYAADRGMKVTLVDPEKNPGGVCLYRGCIPSKALLHVADVITESAHAADFGVTFAQPTIDLDKAARLQEQGRRPADPGAGQVRNLRKVEHVQGTAAFRDARTLDIDQRRRRGKDTLTFEHASSPPARGRRRSRARRSTVRA